MAAVCKPLIATDCHWQTGIPIPIKTARWTCSWQATVNIFLVAEAFHSRPDEILKTIHRNIAQFVNHTVQDQQTKQDSQCASPLSGGCNQQPNECIIFTVLFTKKSPKITKIHQKIHQKNHKKIHQKSPKNHQKSPKFTKIHQKNRQKITKNSSKFNKNSQKITKIRQPCLVRFLLRFVLRKSLTCPVHKNCRKIEDKRTY